MDKTISLIGMFMIILIVGCSSSYPYLEYKTQFIEFPEGGLMCYTEEDRIDRYDKQCVHRDMCESGEYERKCQLLEEYPLDIKANCN